MSTMDVGPTASPRPTKDRLNARPGTVAAMKGARAVAVDQVTSPRGRILRPPRRDAKYPPGSCAIRKPRKNDDWMMPAAPDDHPNS